MTYKVSSGTLSLYLLLITKPTSYISALAGHIDILWNAEYDFSLSFKFKILARKVWFLLFADNRVIRRQRAPRLSTSVMRCRPEEALCQRPLPLPFCLFKLASA